jgi:hypothetical protein
MSEVTVFWPKSRANVFFVIVTAWQMSQVICSVFWISTKSTSESTATTAVVLSAVNAEISDIVPAPSTTSTTFAILVTARAKISTAAFAVAAGCSTGDAELVSPQVHFFV